MPENWQLINRSNVGQLTCNLHLQLQFCRKSKLNMNRTIFNILRSLAAIIMLQTLYFKFSGAAESVYIFTAVGIEPWGRYFTGIMELIASVLLFVPRLTWLGALMGAGLMCGAVFSHLTILGIAVMDDGGYLFFLALTVLLCCSVILFQTKNNIPLLKQRLYKA